MATLMRVLVIAYLLATGANNMAAQDSTYDAQALRVAGVLGLVSPNAVVEARKFKQSYVRGAIGISLAIVSLSMANGLSKIPDLSSVIRQAAWSVGFLSLIFGIREFATAYGALSKSIWWYNRDLADGATSQVR